MKTILTNTGCRSQFIKAAVVSRAFLEHCSDVHELIVHTGHNFDTPVLLPLHPRTCSKLATRVVDQRNITLPGPASYLEMICLLDHCKLVVTGSGGLEKEAYLFEKPCATKRDETEWLELVLCGANQLAEYSRDRILSAITDETRKSPSYASTALYGKGDAGFIVAKTFCS